MLPSLSISDLVSLGAGVYLAGPMAVAGGLAVRDGEMFLGAFFLAAAVMFLVFPELIRARIPSPRDIFARIVQKLFRKESGND